MPHVIGTTPQSPGWKLGGNGGDGNGTSGGDEVIRKITVEQNVRGLNWVVGTLMVAFASAFLFFLLRIDDRFDRVDEPMRQVQMTVAGQTEVLKSQGEAIRDMNGTLREIDRRLHDAPQPERSPSGG